MCILELIQKLLNNKILMNFKIKAVNIQTVNKTPSRETRINKNGLMVLQLSIYKK